MSRAHFKGLNKNRVYARVLRSAFFLLAVSLARTENSWAHESPLRTSSERPIPCSQDSVQQLKKGLLGQLTQGAKIILIGEYHYLPWYEARSEAPVFDLIRCQHRQIIFGLEYFDIDQNSEIADFLSGQSNLEKLCADPRNACLPQLKELMTWLKINRIQAFGLDSNFLEKIYAEESGLWETAFTQVTESLLEPAGLPPSDYAIGWRDDVMADTLIKTQQKNPRATIVIHIGQYHLAALAARLVNRGVDKDKILLLYHDRGFPWDPSIQQKHRDTPSLAHFKLSEKNVRRLDLEGIPSAEISFRPDSQSSSDFQATYRFSNAWIKSLANKSIPSATEISEETKKRCSLLASCQMWQQILKP